MKRYLFLDRLFLVLVFLITFVLLNACGAAPDPTTVQAPESTSTSTHAEATAVTPIVTTTQPQGNTNSSTSFTTISGTSTEPTDNAPGQTIAATTTTTNLALSITEVPLQVTQISQSVPLIETSESKRVGILINDGYIVTSINILPDGLSKKFIDYPVWTEQTYWFDRVIFPNGEEFENVPLVGWAVQAGLAVLGPVDTSAPPLILNNKEDLVPESELYSIGYSAQTYQKLTFVRRKLQKELTFWGVSPLHNSPAIYEYQIGGPLVNNQGKVVGILGSRNPQQDVFWIISSSSAILIVEGLVNGCTAVLDQWFLKTESEDELRSKGKYISVLLSTKSWDDLLREWIELDCQNSMRLEKLDSDYYKGPNPGYKVLYTGPFYTLEEAQGTCWELKRQTSDLCHARRLSQDPQDIEIIYPPKIAITSKTTSLALSTAEVPLQVTQISQSVPLIEMAESKRVGILINGGYIVTSFDMPFEQDLIIDQLSIEYYHYGISLDQSYRFDRVVFPNGEEFENVPLAGWVNLAGLVVLGPVDASAPPLILNNKEELVTEGGLYSIGYSAHNYLEPTFTRRALLYDSAEDPTSWHWHMSFLRTNPAAYEHQIGGPLVNSQGKVVGIYIENEKWAISNSSAVPIVDGLVNGCFSVVHRWFVEAESEGALPRLGEYISVLLSTKSTVDLWQAWIEFDCQDKHALDFLGSDYYESLNPGYYVLYAGTFPTLEEAQSTCWELKRRTPDLCYARRLSQDPQDIEIIYPPKPG